MQLLTKKLSILFVYADDHHPLSNIKKMSQGLPLNDIDRATWLDELNLITQENVLQGCVISCLAAWEVNDDFDFFAGLHGEF